MNSSIAFFVAFLLLLTLAAGEHVCIHDTPRIQKLIYHSGVDNVQPQSYPRFNALATSTIRITTSTLDLYDSTKYCSSTSGSAPDFTGSTMACTSDSLFTDAKRTLLINNIIPAAIAKLQAALKVTAISGNLMVRSTSVCSYFNIPSSDVSTGVANSDFRLYVAAGTMDSTTMAWAGYCQLDQNNRPVVGRVNFNPKYIPSVSTDTAGIKECVDTAVHELFHALGFSYTFASNYFSGTGPFVRTTTARGKTVTQMISPQVVAEARSYHGCSTMTGVELEDEGGSGSALSHWERRNTKEEMMCAAGGSKLSRLSLAFMKDSGHYDVDFSVADAMVWGKNVGCDFFTSKCNTAAGGQGKLFCFDDYGTQNDACTYDRTAVGYCRVYKYTSSLPSYFQYYSNPAVGGAQFLDYCPVVDGYSNVLCTDSTMTYGVSTGGFYYGSDSRCFMVGGSTLKCLQTRCLNGAIVQVKLSGQSWANCASDGSEGTITVGTTTVACPPADRICGDASLLYGTTTTAAATTTLAPTLPTTTLAESSSGYSLVTSVVLLPILFALLL